MTRAFILAAVMPIVGCSSAPAAAPVAVEDPVPVVEIAKEPEVVEPAAAKVVRATPSGGDALRAAPEGFVDLGATVPGVCIYAGYHRADNFTGAQLPGYAAAGAWMLEKPAAALVDVARELDAKGYVLVIYDAYRPYRGTRAMVAWATRTDQVSLLDNGYIARRSGHNHGHTVDLGLAEKDTCALVDMGTAWDTLDERSHTSNATGDVLEKRMILKTAMQAHGFQAYWKEWWHFQFKLEGTKARDVPYGAGEPDEGAWIEPKDWMTPGWTP